MNAFGPIAGIHRACVAVITIDLFRFAEELKCQITRIADTCPRANVQNIEVMYRRGTGSPARDLPSPLRRKLGEHSNLHPIAPTRRKFDGRLQRRHIIECAGAAGDARRFVRVTDNF